MTTEAIFAQGTLLQIGDGATPTEGFTTIAELKSISGPDLSRDSLDVTTHNSPGRWRQFIAGLKDGGQITFNINYVPTDPTHDNVSGLLSLFNDEDEHNIKLVFPDAGTTEWILPCIIVGFSATEPVDNVIDAAITLKVAGTPTLA
jgi:predicted secreted protein